MSLYKNILERSRLMYRSGVFLLMVGMVVSGIGLVLRLFGKGWVVLFVGIGFALTGFIIGQVAEICLTNEMKCLIDSLTAKQAHDKVAEYFQSHGDDVDETEVFLGKLIGEMEWQEKQKKKQIRDT